MVILALLSLSYGFSWQTVSIKGSGYEGEQGRLLDEEPHPRRYWPIWSRLLQGTNQTEDLGVYDPVRKIPQHDPRIPY